MAILLTGLLLFCGVHLVTALLPAGSSRVRDTLGPGAFKGLYALLAVAGVSLMVFGWRQTTPALVYLPPRTLFIPAYVLTFAGFVLMALPQRQSVVKRYIRHPQLTGVLLWALAHLGFNGDTRSLVLFSGLGLWCVAEIAAINHRDGPREAPPAPGVAYELKTLAVAAVVFTVVVALHPWLAGVPALYLP